MGIKEGDWVEYEITMKGNGIPPPSHDVRWMRMEVLSVGGSAFSVNLTALYANGTIGSAVWKYNFTEGNVGGWTIIPANLNAGETFFDFSIHNHKPVNVTIQREEQKIVLGATREVTYGNDSIRHIKEWDKATGFFIGSEEVIQNVTNKDGWYIEDLTVTTKAVATNLWNRQILGLEQSVFALVVACLVLAVATSASALIISQRRRLTNLSNRYPILKNRLISAGIIVAVVLLGATVIPSAFWMNMGLSDAEVNLIMQSFWVSLIFASTGLRRTGRFFEHGFLMMAVVASTVIGFSLVIFMSPPTSGSMDGYFTSPLKVAEVVVHSVLSIPAIALGVWLVVLWRPNATTFSAKSKRIAKWTVILWTLSYVAGVLGYIADYTPFLGSI